MLEFTIFKSPEQSEEEAQAGIGRVNQHMAKQCPGLYEHWHIQCPHCNFVKYLATHVNWKENGCPHCHKTSKLPKEIVDTNGSSRFGYIKSTRK